MVGPCDAGTPAPHTHTVTLWLENLFDVGGSQIPPGEWDNPCPTGGAAPGCSLEFQCSENEDVAVTFNLTVMRDANQGFFDVAVNFEDVFCSAKLDCSYDENHNGNVDPGEEIKMLFNGQTRDYTAIIGLACTAGPSDNDTTTLHLSDVRVRCDGTAMQLTSAEPILCAPDGTVLGFGFGFLNQGLYGIPAGSLAAIGFRMIDNATAPWGYQYEPFTLPSPGSVWGFGGGDQPFEGFFPQAFTGNFTSAGNVTGPRIAGLLMDMQPGQTMETAFSGMRPAIGWIPPTSQGDVTFQAVLENPASVSMVTSFHISGGNGAWLVAIQDMKSENPWGPPVAWHLTPILAHIDDVENGVPGSPPSLVGTILGDLGSGVCRVDLVKDDLAVGSCPLGADRRNVVWDFNDAPVNNAYVAIQLPQFVLPNVNPATDWVTRGTAGGVIGIPNETTLIAENLYYSHTGAAPGGMPIAQLSATVYTRASSAFSWTTASASHLEIASAMQVEGRDSGWDLPWRDDISAYGHDFMVITAQVWNAGGGVADRRNLVLATPADEDFTSPLLTWSEMSTAFGTELLDYATGLTSIVNPATGTLKRYAVGTHYGVTSPTAVIWPLPDAGDLPANQGGVGVLSTITLPAPAGIGEFHYHMASWHHRLSGPTGEERVAIVGGISNDMERSLANVAWFLEYDAGAAGNVTIGEPQFMASANGEDLSYMDSMRSGETFGWWTEQGGPGNSSYDRRIRVGEVDRDWDAQAQRCDKLFANGFSAPTNGPNGGGGRDVDSGYVFEPSYSTADPAALDSNYPLAEPSPLERRFDKRGRRNMVDTTDAAGRVFTTVIGITEATGEPFVGGLRYATPTSTPVPITDPGFTQYDGLAVQGFLDNSTAGQYGLAMFANVDGVDASPIVDAGLAIVDVALATGAVTVKEALTPPAGWSVNLSRLDATTGILVAGTSDEQSLGGGSWFDVWNPSHFVFFKPTTSFTFTGWSNFGEQYPSGGSPNGYENAIRMSNPECTSCTGDACMTCQVLDVRDGKAVAKCTPTILCDDLPGYYFWDLLATPSGGAIGSTRLGDPTAAALDPDYTSGTRNPSDSQEFGVFLTTVGDTYPVFMASYGYVVPPQGMDPEMNEAAVVVWPMTSATAFGAPVVFFKGSPGGWFSALDGYIFGVVYDEENGANLQRPMVLKEPATFAGATTPNSWLRWSSLSIPGQTVTNIMLANPLPGRDLFYGTYETGTGPALPFVAELSGTNSTIQQAFGNPAALGATIPSATQWETNGYAWVRFAAAASPKAQPAGMVTINGNPANVVVWNIPDDLTAPIEFTERGIRRP